MTKNTRPISLFTQTEHLLNELGMELVCIEQNDIEYRTEMGGYEEQPAENLSDFSFMQFIGQAGETTE